jgi:2-phosphosulfolactate phosphatase
MSGLDVRFDWGLDGSRRLATKAKVVVTIDVLSITTCVDVATGRGAVLLPHPGMDTDVARYTATPACIRHPL